MKTKMHENSLLAYHAGRWEQFGEREQLILRALKEIGQGTHRDIQNHLDAAEVAFVQPRCSDLIKAGVLEECGKVKCPLTGHPVRLLRIRPYSDPAQLEMFG